ncbi:MULTISPECIES: hypothetical protein [Arthrobacter]|nr:hypothetical protein [Arthrobacter globiformis]
MDGGRGGEDRVVEGSVVEQRGSDHGGSVNNGADTIRLQLTVRELLL